MATFKANGKDWIVAIDAPTIRRIRDLFDGLDLVGLDGKAYQMMVDDPTLLVDVLWVLCAKQAEGHKMSDEDFGRMLVGESLDHAAKAMKEAILDFSPSQTRALLTALADKNAAIREAGMRKAIEKINDPALQERAIAALEADMDEAIAKAMTRLSSATNTPASAESAPTA